MLGGHLSLDLRIGFLCPLAQHGSTQLSNLVNHPILGVVCIAPIGHGLFERVDDLVQPLEHFRSLRQALFKSTPVFGVRGFQQQFIIHEPL